MISKDFNHVWAHANYCTDTNKTICDSNNKDTQDEEGQNLEGKKDDLGGQQGNICDQDTTVADDLLFSDEHHNDNTRKRDDGDKEQKESDESECETQRILSVKVQAKGTANLT